MNTSPALSVFLAALLSTQILVILTTRSHFQHILTHLHELMKTLAPLKIDMPQIKGAYASGYKAGVMEQTRRQNEELNSSKKPPTELKGDTAQ